MIISVGSEMTRLLLWSPVLCNSGQADVVVCIYKKRVSGFLRQVWCRLLQEKDRIWQFAALASRVVVDGTYQLRALFFD